MSRATQVPSNQIIGVSPTRLSRPVVHLSKCFGYTYHSIRRRSYYPNHAVTSLVWALPLSLATTRGITVVFFSCGYLDVSVPRVRLTLQRDVMIAHDGFPHSDICGSIRICQSPQLFAAYHVLLRLLEPQASPMRPFLLSFYHNEILVTSYLLLLLIFRLFRLLELISISQYLLDLRFQYVNVLFLFCSPRQI